MNQQQALMQAHAMQQARAQGHNLFNAFVYSASVTLASATSGSATVQIQTDAPFMIQATACFAYNTTLNTETASPIATVNLVDLGSGAYLYDAPQYLRNVFGTAQLPMLWPTPRILLPGTQLQVAVVNVSSVNSTLFQFSFLGQKLSKG